MKVIKWRSLLWETALIIALLGLLNRFVFGTDTTDVSHWNRSGMALRIDELTGCHYLATFWGGITPRLDVDGNHICTGQENGP